MNVCFLLHFYQPSNQFGEVVKKIANESYLPLIRLIKNDKRLHITANISLSLLEQLERYGYSQLLRDIKELVNAGRVEIVGSAAYHPLLTKIPSEFVDKQVILQEMAYAHYFGNNKDFEGEDCFMIKNVVGFFPPEMAANEAVLDQISSLGYSWVALDEYCLPKEVREVHKSGFCYLFSNPPLKLIIRDRALTNMISFKRDLDIAEIVKKIVEGGGNKVIALDAETFGHHFHEGIYLLESLISDLHDRGVKTATISQAFSEAEGKKIPHLKEATWSTHTESAYPLWVNPDSCINKALWKLMGDLHLAYADKIPEEKIDTEGCLPIWKSTESVLLNFLKLEQSDQFWWSTGYDVMGKINYSKYMVSSALDYYKGVVEALGDSGGLSDQIVAIEDLLTKNSSKI